MNNKVVKLVFGLVALLLVSGVMLLFARADKAGQVGVRSEMTNLVAGLACYHAVFGNFPTGGNAQIVNSLRGENPRRIMFDPVGPRRLNKGKELADIWDTPYQFEFQSNSTISVSSAGINGLFGDNDDLVVSVSLTQTNFPFWKIPAQFTNNPPQP